MRKSIIILIIALLTFLPPTIKLWKVITITEDMVESSDMSNITEFMSNVNKYRDPEKMKNFNNTNFELYISSGLLTDDEANKYLEWIEGKYQKILDYMSCRKTIIEDDKKIEIFLIDTPGTSFCGGDYFVVYYDLDWKGVSVHEMTHSIDFKLARQEMLNESISFKYDNFLQLLYSNNKQGLSSDYFFFFLEQRAVHIENKFGENVGYPNYGIPINAFIYELLRNRAELESFKEFNTMDLLEDDEPDLTTLMYSVAGSFGNFLVKEYDFDKYNKVISKGYYGAFNKTLEELEVEWLSSFNRGILIQKVLMILSILLILAISHFWLKQKAKKFWIGLPATIFMLLSFLSWGYYFSYGDNDLWGLVLAVLVGSLFKIWKTKAGIITLWVVGFLTAILPQVI